MTEIWPKDRFYHIDSTEQACVLLCIGSVTLQKVCICVMILLRITTALTILTFSHQTHVRFRTWVIHLLIKLPTKVISYSQGTDSLISEIRTQTPTAQTARVWRGMVEKEWQNRPGLRTKDSTGLAGALKVKGSHWTPLSVFKVEQDQRAEETGREFKEQFNQQIRGTSTETGSLYIW